MSAAIFVGSLLLKHYLWYNSDIILQTRAHARLLTHGRPNTVLIDFEEHSGETQEYSVELFRKINCYEVRRTRTGKKENCVIESTFVLEFFFSACIAKQCLCNTLSGDKVKIVNVTNKKKKTITDFNPGTGEGEGSNYWKSYRNTLEKLFDVTATGLKLQCDCFSLLRDCVLRAIRSQHDKRTLEPSFLPNRRGLEGINPCCVTAVCARARAQFWPLVVVVTYATILADTGWASVGWAEFSNRKNTRIRGSVGKMERGMEKFCCRIDEFQWWRWPAVLRTSDRSCTWLCRRI